MANRNLKSRLRRQSSTAFGKRRRSGATTIQVLVLLVPVLFGLFGFAVDLGRLYMIRGELKNAANSMALAAAQQLVGTSQATDMATIAAMRAQANTSGFANKWDYGGILLGDSLGLQTSSVNDPQYFDTVSDATGASSNGTQGATSSGASSARAASISVTANAPLLFFRFLPLNQLGTTPITTTAVAGVSAPLCVGCGTEVAAIAALDQTDTVDFGFTSGTRYTFAYQCTVNNGLGGAAPTALPNTTTVLNYVMLDRYNTTATVLPSEDTQMFRIGAGGLPGSVVQAQACFTVNNVEAVWASALPTACGLPLPTVVSAWMCGLDVRFEGGVPAGCDTITDVSTATGPYLADTDLSDNDDYTSYVGTGRRVINAIIVDSFSDTSNITVLGYRQFFVQPQANGTNLNVGDAYARFAATYISYPVPLKQGSFAGCSITNGPGKVVLHQ